MSPLDAAAGRLVRNEGARLVVGYGSFAAGTEDAASDLDLAAWAPVSAPRHLTGRFEGRELDAWIYPVDHPFHDDTFVRLDPLVCLHDAEGRFETLRAAVAQTRRRLVVPVGAETRDDLLAWAAKMLVRAGSTSPEGLHRYHWLLSELPELWCAAAGVPWEGPKKALARMRTLDPDALTKLAGLSASAPDAEALGRWLDRLPRLG